MGKSRPGPIAEFSISSLPLSWVALAIKIDASMVTLYINCQVTMLFFASGINIIDYVDNISIYVDKIYMYNEQIYIGYLYIIF